MGLAGERVFGGPPGAAMLEEAVSRYARIRRRLAPLAFGLAIALLARESCQKETRTHATIVLDLQDQAATARTVDAELVVGEDRFVFHRAALPGMRIGPCQFPVAMPAEDGELRIDLELGSEPGSEHRQLVRRIHAVDGATVTVTLGTSATIAR